MKVPWSVRCDQCGRAWKVESTGDDEAPQSECPQCGVPTIVLSDGLTRTKVFIRAQAELNQGDVSLSLILSAMAVECELARLFFKWKALDADMSPFNVPEPQKSDWEKEYRDLRTVSAKLDGVCRLLVGMDFDSYIASDTALDAAVGQQNPSYKQETSKKLFFQERLFWKRNDIIHYGNIALKPADGESGLAVGLTILTILQAGDKVRIKKLDEKLAERVNKL